MCRNCGDITIEHRGLPPDSEVKPRGKKQVIIDGPKSHRAMVAEESARKAKYQKRIKSAFIDQRAAWNALTAEQRGLIISLTGDQFNSTELARAWEEIYKQILGGGYVQDQTALMLVARDWFNEEAQRNGFVLPDANDAMNSWISQRQTGLVVEYVKQANLSAGISLSYLSSRAFGDQFPYSSEAGRKVRESFFANMIGINEKCAESGIKAFADALDAGKTAEQALSIQRTVGLNNTLNRQQTYASNEIASAWNEKIRQQLQDAVNNGRAYSERLVKRWWTSKDDRVCPICGPLDGSIVGFETPFSTDPQARYFNFTRPPLHIGCRCSIQYETYTAAGEQPMGIAA